jgi:hypothetical protein
LLRLRLWLRLAWRHLLWLRKRAILLLHIDHVF